MSLLRAWPLILVFISQLALAKEPSVIFGKVAGREAPIGIVAIEDAYIESGSNCQQHIAEVVVGDIAYDGPSEIIAGFRVDPTKATNGVTLYRIDRTEITSGQMRELQKLVKKGSRLIVLAQTCGMGQFTTVRELWIKAALGQ